LFKHLHTSDRHLAVIDAAAALPDLGQRLHTGQCRAIWAM